MQNFLVIGMLSRDILHLRRPDVSLQITVCPGILAQSPLHGDKFSTEDQSFDGGLLFGNPIDAGHINVDKETGARAAGQFFAGVVAVNPHTDVDRFTEGSWHVIRDSFLDVAL